MPDTRTDTNRYRRVLSSILVTGLLCASLAPMSGCAIAGLVSVMARTWEQTGSSRISAEYDELSDKTFAVVVFADRGIEGVHPRLATRVSERATLRLANVANTNASGFVPARFVLEFQLTTPSWTSWTYDQLLEEFGVDRLIVIEISEFLLNEPGNQYIWDGRAVARVGVVEAGSALPDDFTYSKDIRVTYPDGRGFTQNDLSRDQVYGYLENRMLDRITWLFYEHEEANAIKY